MVHSWIAKELESSLLPVEGTKAKKTACYLFQSVKFSLLLAPYIATALITFILSRIFRRNANESPLVAFSKKPTWIDRMESPPAVNIGFATCDFQENGPSFHPNTNWAKFIESRKDKVGHLGEFPGLWEMAEIKEYIDRLHAMHVKHVRISVSRDKIEPQEGQYDLGAIQHYRDFLRELKRNGITPIVTLHHFTDPIWFTEKGGWENRANNDGFVAFSEMICTVLYEEGVRKICTFNEPGIMFSQGYLLGNFPPACVLKIDRGCHMVENLMRTHVMIYENVKKKHPDLMIGLAHNSLRYLPYHYWNPIAFFMEKVICHYMTEIYHSAFVRFYQTGVFSLKVPFLANHVFSLGKPFPLDFYGLQYYTDPLLKASLRKGLISTGYSEEAMTSYEYRAFPQGLATALEEGHSLRTPEGGKMPIEITEIGIDIGINTDMDDKERIRYFDKLLQVVQFGLEKGVNIRSTYFWTNRDNIEWYKGWGIRFGFHSYDPATKETKSRPVAHWLKNLLAKAP